MGAEDGLRCQVARLEVEPIKHWCGSEPIFPRPAHFRAVEKSVSHRNRLSGQPLGTTLMAEKRVSEGVHACAPAQHACYAGGPRHECSVGRQGNAMRSRIDNKDVRVLYLQQPRIAEHLHTLRIVG
eukprot:782493-Prymnesium_polylepis.1